MMDMEDVKGRGHRLIWYYFGIWLEGLSKARKGSVRITGVRADI
jgi:hypothetical protein